jgi:predicted RNase H-like nuclease (RuvC/YqgF family)
MSALDKLKEKVQAWKARIEELETENAALREQLASAAQGGEEVEALRKQLSEYEKTIADLRNEITEKDDEIEEIIAKVEALLA